MLEWMQRHKKWLIVTIWISVIALVSAGMVGWNPNSFSFSGDQVAKVGQIKITKQEFSNAYQRVFNEYNKVLGGNLDQNEAKRFGLEKIALQQLVQKAQLQSLAKDLGLRVQDSEVVDTITKNSNFQKNGQFDDSLYRQLLKDNHLSVKFFEESVRDSLLIGKLINIMPVSVSSLETLAVGSTLSLSDTVLYQVLEPSSIKTKITDSMLKSYWKEHQSQYISKGSIELAAVGVSIKAQHFNDSDLLKSYEEDKSLYLDDQGRLKDFSEAKSQVQHNFQSQEAQKKAIRIGNELRDSKKIETSPLVITLDEEVPEELTSQIGNIAENQVIKPFLYKNQYIVGRVIKKIPQHQKSYEEAKNQVLADLKNEISIRELKEKANKLLPLHTGKTIKISSIVNPKINEINEKEKQIVVRSIFSSNQKSGIIMLDKGAFVYTITNQELPMSISSQAQGLVQNIKSQVIDSALMDYLNHKYPPKYYLQNLEIGVEIGQ